MPERRLLDSVLFAVDCLKGGSALVYVQAEIVGKLIDSTGLSGPALLMVGEAMALATEIDTVAEALQSLPAARGDVR